MGINKWTKRNGYLSLAGIKYWRSDWDDTLRYVAGDGIHSTSTGSAYICILEHTSSATNEPGVGVDWQDYWQILVEGGNGNVFIDVSQTGHGLTVGDYVRQSTTTPNSYVPAQANTLLNAVGVGFVVDVVDQDSFVLVQTGYVKNSPGAVPSYPEGTILYLDPTTPGAVTDVQPVGVGQYVKPVAIITEDGASMWVLSDFPVVVGGGGVAGVQSVTDDGKGIVNVNNIDPSNPVVEFDEVALANYADFIDALIGNTYFTTSLAHDSNFITELTQDTNFQNEVNNFVNSGGGVVSQGNQFFFKGYIVNNPSTPELQNKSTVMFSDQLFVIEAGDSSYSRYAPDANTGALTKISLGSITGSLCTSEDGLSLYGLSISQPGGFNTPVTWTLKEWDTSFNLVQTSTYTSGNTVLLQTALPATPFFVANGHLVAEASMGAFGTDRYWTDFTISGASLTSPSATNLKYYTYIGNVNVRHQQATYKSGFSYMQRYVDGVGISDQIEKRTYSALTFGSSTVSTSPIPNQTPSTGSVWHGGFEVTAANVVGRWRNTSVAMYSPTPGGANFAWINGVYNKYTF